MIAGDPFFTARQERLAALSIRHAVPAVSQGREFAVAGGLMSYGGSITEAYRLAGVYAARISKVKSLASCQYSSPRKLNCSSTSRPPRRSASRSRSRSSAAPTKLSNETSGLYCIARRGYDLATPRARAAAGPCATDRCADAVPADKHGNAGAGARLPGRTTKTWLGSQASTPSSTSAGPVTTWTSFAPQPRTLWSLSGRNPGRRWSRHSDPDGIDPLNSNCHPWWFRPRRTGLRKKPRSPWR